MDKSHDYKHVLVVHDSNAVIASIVIVVAVDDNEIDLMDNKIHFDYANRNHP